MREFKGYLKLLVLHIVSKAPSHGYSIMGKISEMLGSEPPSPGALYPLLLSLERQGLVSSKVEGKRKVYSLTEKGSRYLEENSKELEKTLAFAKRIKKFNEVGGSELKNVAKLVFENVPSLSPSQEKELRKIMEDLKKKVQRVIYGGG